MEWPCEERWACLESYKALTKHNRNDHEPRMSKESIRVKFFSWVGIVFITLCFLSGIVFDILFFLLKVALVGLVLIFVATMLGVW